MLAVSLSIGTGESERRVAERAGAPERRVGARKPGGIGPERKRAANAAQSALAITVARALLHEPLSEAPPTRKVSRSSPGCQEEQGVRVACPVGQGPQERRSLPNLPSAVCRAWYLRPDERLWHRRRLRGG